MHGRLLVGLSLLIVLALAACAGPEEGGVILSAPDLSPAPTQSAAASPLPATATPATPTATPWPTPESTAVALDLPAAPAAHPALSTTNAVQVEALAVLRGHEDVVNALVFLADGALLLSTSADRTARWWDTAEGVPISTVTAVFQSTGSQSTRSFFYDLTWPGGGERLYVWIGSTQAAVARWDGDRDHPPQEYWPFYPTRPGDDRSVVSPDGQMRASSSFRFSIGTDVSGQIYLESDAGQSATLEGHDSYVVDLAFSPDGTLLASTGNEQTLLWEVDRARLVGELPGTMDHPASVQFSPDGRRLYVVGYYGEVRAWDVQSGDPLPPLIDEDPLHAMAFAPGDPHLLAAGYADGTVRLWDMAAGARLAAWTGHDAPVRRLAFSEDGTLLASADEGGAIRLWGVPAAPAS